MPRKGGETVDSNGSSTLFGSADLNEVCAARVSTLRGEAGIGESSSRCLGGISAYKNRYRGLKELDIISYSRLCKCFYHCVIMPT